MNTPHLLSSVLGAGFYRYWHVPAPNARLDIRATRRADLSVIGPGALALLAASVWAAGRVGTAVLLDERVATPFDSLPGTARLLVATGLLGLALAAAWWLATARTRARVAGGVAEGRVARIPDDPAGASEPLHAAVSELGRTLRDRPATPLAEPAFEVLRAGAAALSVGHPQPVPEQRRLRRRCLAMTQRLQGSAAHGGDRPAHDPAAA